MGRPGEMLGEQRRLVAVDHAFQAWEVLSVQPAGAADRKSNGVHRQRRAAAKLGQQAVGSPAIAHIVLGMNLEESEAVIDGKRLFGVLRLESDTDACRRVRAVLGECRGGHVRFDALPAEGERGGEG